MPQRKNNLLAGATILAFSGMLGGCADYLNNRDGVTLRAGNSGNANAAIHSVDPQANRAEQTRIYTDGKYIRNVMDQYHERPAPEAAATPTASVPAR